MELENIVARDYCVVHLYAFEIKYDADQQLGVDIDRIVTYTFSWQNLLANQGNPIQALAVSVAASLKASEGVARVTDVIDTDVGLLSGKQVAFQTGEDVDRPIYTESQYGVSVISGYNTQHTGLIINMRANYDSRVNWYIDFSIENSTPENNEEIDVYGKKLTNLDTVAKLSASSPVQLLAKLDAGEVKETMSNGIPFLAEIPLLGYLFRVTKEVQMKRTMYFVLQLKPNAAVPQNKLDEKGLYHLNDVLKKEKAYLESKVM